MAVAGLFIAAAGALQPVLAAEDSDANSCLRAGLDAERKLDLPPGLLLAIGRVESGRLDPATGRVAAWPWTINAGGAGQLFAGLPEALAATRALRGSGVASVDVGCFQINLFHHPTAFASLEQAFDPPANAAYAARFLSELRGRTGSWQAAVAAYHSATPELGGPYRDRVLAAWPDANIAPAAEVGPHVMRTMVWTPARATDRMRIWTPSPVGTAPSVISIRLSSR